MTGNEGLYEWLNQSVAVIIGYRGAGPSEGSNFYAAISVVFTEGNETHKGKEV